MKRLVFSKSIFKSLTPEQQAGLQNIGALIDQMLQSGQADVQQQQQPMPPKAPPKMAPPAQGAQPPAGVAALKDLEGDQKKLRIGGLSQNEGDTMGKNPKPAEEAEAETDRAENLGGKMDRVSKADLGQSEGKGFRGNSPLMDGGGEPMLGAEEEAGKKRSPVEHPGNDANTSAEGRLGDLPMYDEEATESAMQEGNEEGEAPGGSNPSATANKGLALLKTIARALNIREERPVRKSADDDIRAEVREVRKAVEYLIMKMDPIGARAAGVVASIEKELDRGPVLRNDSTDDKSAIVMKALLAELQKSNPKVFGAEGGSMADVRKALREEGLPALLGLAGGMWAGGVR